MQYEEIGVVLKDAQAKAGLRNLDEEIKNLIKLGETGITINYDKHGNVLRVTSQLKDEFGNIVSKVREWNAESKKLEEKSSRLSYNYEKMYKESADAALRRMQYLEAYNKLKDEEIKKEQELQRLQKEQNDKMVALMTSGAMSKKEQVEGEYEQQRQLLELQHEQEVEAIRIWDAEQKRSEEQREQLELSKQQYQYYYLLSQIYSQEKSSRTTKILDAYSYDATAPIQQYIDNLVGVNREQSKINETTSVFATISDRAYGEYAARNNLAAEATENLSGKQRELGTATEETAKKAEKSNKAFTLLHTVFLRLAHTAISAVTRSFREALTEMKNVDSELVVVRKVSNATAEELETLKERAYDVGKQYGIVASDYLNAAAEMTRAGYREQAGDLAELATKLQLVGDVSQDTANKFLIATDKAYRMDGNFQQLASTIDKLNEIDNNYATSIQKVADGIGLLAPVASQAHVSFEEMSAAIGTITAVTQRSGTESARALRSLFLNIIKDTRTEIEEGETVTIEQINNLQDALKKYAPEVIKAAQATGELINPMEALNALSKAYNDNLLTEQELTSIVYGIGGKLRSAQLLALIQNWDLYNQMLETTADAAGSADREVENALDSWDKKLNQLKNTWTDFVSSVLDTKAIKGFIDMVNLLVKSLEEPEKYSEQFKQAVSDALKYLVDEIPTLTDIINRLSLELTGALLNALKEQIPHVVEQLFDAAKNDTKEVLKNLPEHLGDIGTIFGEVLGEFIVNSLDFGGIGFEIATNLLYGIIEGLANGFVNTGDGIYRVIEAKVQKYYEEKHAEEIARQERELEYTAKGLEFKTRLLEEHAQAAIEAADANGEFADSESETAKAVNSLEDKLESATTALETYKTALEGGEKGDTFKSIAEAYKSAVELFSKGLTGSNAYMAAIDMLLPEEVVRAAHYDYEELGKQLGGDLFKAMFAKEGGDYGSNFANYIRENIDAYSDFVSIIEEGEGKFSFFIKDMEGFSEATGMSQDVLWALVDALDIFDSKLTYTVDDITSILDEYSDAVETLDNNRKRVNLAALITDLVKDGKTEREIRSIVSAIQDLSKTNPNIQINEPENLDETLDSIMKLNEEAEKDPHLDVEIESNKDEFFEDLYYECKTFDGVVYVGVKYKELNTDKGSSYEEAKRAWSQSLLTPEKSIKAQKYAIGTKYASGGISLVNEKGAELITTNDKAYIVARGNPSVVDLPTGATVYTAEETRSILSGGDISTIKGYDDTGTGYYKVKEGAEGSGSSGIPIEKSVLEATETTTETGTGGGSGGSGGGGKSKSKDKDKDFLAQLKEYISELLEGSKEALDAQKKSIDAQIEALRKQRETQEDIDELEQLQLKIIEAEQSLEEAQSERTVRYFNPETGQWEWKADERAVEQAQKKLEDAQKAYQKKVDDLDYERQVEELQQQKEALDEEYGEISKKWETILEGIEESLSEEEKLSIQEILKLLGKSEAGGDAKKKVKKLIKEIGQFTESVQLGDDETDRILSVGSNGTVGSSASLLSKILGVGSYDLGSVSQSIYNATHNGGATANTYYINGVRIGGDVMDRPLSEILSVLPIYAN